MEKDELGQALAASAAEVLETMFFTSIEEASDQTEIPSGDWVSARLRFRGAPSGSLSVSVSAEAARTVAAGFLGCEEEEVGDAQMIEVVSELANMICGSLLSRVESDTTFELLHPEPFQGVPGTGALAGARLFVLDNGGLAVSVELESEHDGQPSQD